MSYQPTPAAPKSAGKALTWLGALCIVAGLGAGIAVYFTAQGRFDSRVKSLASDSGALSGCVTDLSFTKTGTFVLYYLSEGDVAVNGSNDGCADDDVVGIDADSDVPDMEVTLTDEDGDAVRLSRTSLDADTALTAGGVRAWPWRQVNIRSEGDYRIEITSDSPDRFAIGVGPKIEKPDLLMPALVFAIGLVLGIVLIVIAGVRRSAARRQPTGTAVGAGYPAQPGFQAPGQYPQQPPVMYQPPAAQGFDHPTQAMPPISPSPEPVPPFHQPAAGPPAGPPPAEGPSPWARPEPTGWTTPQQPPAEGDDETRHQ